MTKKKQNITKSASVQSINFDLTDRTFKKPEFFEDSNNYFVKMV